MSKSGAMRIAAIALLLLGAVLFAPAPAGGQGEPDWQSEADILFQTMSPAERIGQLFLVTFEGDRAAADSAVADLILNYHVGGVALLSENDNLTGYGDPANTPQQVSELTANLQRLALLGISNEPSTSLDEDVTPTPQSEELPVPIPLIIATRNDGDALPVANVTAGFTAVPNAMALGATWEP
ncbi:MAG TPA: hypothetical protein PKE20_11225, partial [Promineifilum sp.]|nr:hypothetical protein [Promineifilum sp.]